MILIMITGANMGPECDEADFNAWAEWVANNVGTVVAGPVEVEQFPFHDAPGEDRIIGATDPERDAIREWLAITGWDAFCGTPDAWPTRDARHVVK